MKALIGKKLGNYHLQRILGQGRMGVVFLAHDRALLRPTALKLLAWTMDKGVDQDPVKWFLSEARSVARISHPNVIQIYNIAKHGEYRYIAMEYVDGTTAEQKLIDGGRFTPEGATDILVQTAAALEAAHSCGVVHRDVKPANLLLRSDGVLKLSDFGMALSNQVNDHLTATMRVGTPYFNAPEAWEGRPASPSADIYALGVTYFLLLTGKLPFEAKNMHELQWKHLHAPIPDPREHVPSLPSACKALIDTCLAKTPHNRCASAKTLREQAKKLLSLMNDSGETGGTRTRFIDGRRPKEKPRQRGYETASATWSRSLNFSIDPFSAVDPLNTAYKGEPFSAASEAFNEALASGAKLVQISGAPGTGRSTVCRRHALQRSPASRTFAFSGIEWDSDESPLAQLAHHAGVDPLNPEAPTEVARWLDRRIHTQSIITLDEFSEDDTSLMRIAELAEIVVQTSSCSLVMVSTERFADAIAAAVPDIKATSIPIRALKPKEVADYIRSWIKKALLPVAKAILFSTDACLLATHYSGGNLKKINRIIRRTLRIAAKTGRNVISSWEVWAVCASTETGHSPASGPIPARPTPWPNREITTLLNEYRRGAGIPPVVTSAIPTGKKGGTI